MLVGLCCMVWMNGMVERKLGFLGVFVLKIYLQYPVRTVGFSFKRAWHKMPCSKPIRTSSTHNASLEFSVFFFFFLG
jgi:hypothetical protein